MSRCRDCHKIKKIVIFGYCQDCIDKRMVARALDAVDGQCAC